MHLVLVNILHQRGQGRGRDVARRLQRHTRTGAFGLQQLVQREQHFVEGGLRGALDEG